MSDIRRMFDDRYLGSWDLEGGDRVATIVRVEQGELEGEKGRKDLKPLVYIQESKKALVLNKTNMHTIAKLYGYDASKWTGKQVMLYPTQTQVGRETKDCIRVRPQRPKPQRAAGAPPPPPREPGDDSDQEDADAPGE